MDVNLMDMNEMTSDGIDLKEARSGNGHELKIEWHGIRRDIGLKEDYRDLDI